MPARHMNAFQILAEPVRLYLVELLCVGEQTSGDLAIMAFARFGIGWGAVSRHLGTLRASGFVRVVRDGERRLYLLNDDWLRLLERPLDDLREDWRLGVSSRRLGFAVARDDDGPSVPINSARRGLRGRAVRTLAERGLGRTTSVDDADVTADFE